MRMMRFEKQIGDIGNMQFLWNDNPIYKHKNSRKAL
jgi:hypothetical protein